MVCDRIILESRGGSRDPMARERRLARRLGLLWLNAAVLGLPSAVMFLVALGVTRSLALAVLAGSPAVLGAGFALCALVTRARLAALTRHPAVLATSSELDPGAGSPATSSPSRRWATVSPAR